MAQKGAARLFFSRPAWAKSGIPAMWAVLRLNSFIRVRACGVDTEREKPTANHRPFLLFIPLGGKTAQPPSSEKNAASNAAQTPCARRAVGIFLTKARKSATAANRAFEEKQPLVFLPENPEAWYVDKDTKLHHVQENVPKNPDENRAW